MIWLQTATVFQLGRGTISVSYSVYMGLVMLVGQTGIHTVRLLVPEPSALEIEVPIKKLKRHKSPSIDQIPPELIKAGGRIIRSDIRKLIISIWNKEELPEERKESIIAPIYKKGDKTDCNNYRGL